MTDYLERALREDVDALLEAERRLAAALLPRRAEGELSEEWEDTAPGQAYSAPADGEARTVQVTRQVLRELVWPAESVRRTARARQGREALSEAELDGGASASGEARAEAAPRPALLEQLEYTERAVFAGLSVVGTGRRSKVSAFSSALEGRRVAAGSLQAAAEPPEAFEGSPGRRSDSPWSEEDLAARVDRSFQRDARRYDNGFFLY